MKLTIDGLPPFDGNYKVVLPPYVRREWHEIKTETGLLPRDFEDALERMDQDAFAALVWVTLTREGFPARQVWRTLDEADMFNDHMFQIETEPAEEETENPPALTPEPPPETAATGAVNGNSSGASTSGPSDAPETTHETVGVPI